MDLVLSRLASTPGTALVRLPVIEKDKQGGEPREEYASTGQLRWSQKVGDAVVGVQVADGVVYVSAATGEGPVLSALDTSTGKLRWRAQMEEKVPSAPAVANGAVALTSTLGDLYAFSPFDGHLLWHSKSAGQVQVAATGAQMFRVEADAAGASSLSAIDPWLGTVRWSVPAPGVGQASVSLWAAHGAVYATRFAAAQQVSYEVAFNASDGTQIWQSQAFTAPAHPPGALVEGSAQLYLPLADGSLIAFAFGSGEQLWSYTPAAGEAAPPLGGTSPSAGERNRVVYVGEQGHLTALDVEDGSVIKRIAIAQYRGSPFIVGGTTLFVTSTDGVIHQLNLEDGSQVWQYAQPKQERAFDATAMVLAPFK